MAVNPAQEAFLRNGGPLVGVLAHKYQTGELDPNYVFREYPKMVRIDRGTRKVTRSTQAIRGNETQVIEWEEDVHDVEEIIVQSEAEEERVLSGGKTEAQVEEERQDMLAQARARGINVDASWGLVRLQRELGAAPSNETIAALQRQVSDLQEKADLRRRIADLEAQLSGRAPDEAEDMRAQLRALGIEPDGRWGAAKLRAELDKATAPHRD